MVRHSSRIFLSRKALKNNLHFIQKKTGPHPRLSAVVKANAYGHGIPQMIRLLESCGVDHFSVASAFEAEAVLEHCSPDSRIMIMGILYEEDIAWAIEHGIEFYVFAYARLPYILAQAKKTGKPAFIHLEIETGTNRTGLNPDDLGKTIAYFKRHRAYLHFAGVCTHLGGAENLSNQFKVRPQIELFKKVLRELKRRDYLPDYRHMACSATTLAYPETHYDMVRVGIALYGFWPSPDIYHLHLQEVGKLSDNPLRRVLTWKTDIMDIKEVAQGQFVGYGTAFQATRDMRIAVLPIGYSNGYPRSQSNKGHVLIGGKKAPITGLVNMNLFMVDISHIPEARIGDEVVLIGKQGRNVINVGSFTDFSNLLNTEMLSRLPAAIPRMVVS